MTKAAEAQLLFLRFSLSLFSLCFPSLHPPVPSFSSPPLLSLSLSLSLLVATLPSSSFPFWSLGNSGAQRKFFFQLCLLSPSDVSAGHNKKGKKKTHTFSAKFAYCNGDVCPHSSPDLFIPTLFLWRFFPPTKSLFTFSCVCSTILSPLRREKRKGASALY